MTMLTRSALCCAMAMAVLALTGGAAAARAKVPPAPSPQALLLPAELSNVCEADPQALQLAMARHWQPSLNSLDQWTQLVRSFACDLSGSRDLGWHRVPLRAYESAIRYPLSWIETETRNGKPRRVMRTYYSAAQLPPKIDFWVGGRIEEIRYDKRLRRIEARFPAAGSRASGNGAASAVAVTQCAFTTLQFRQQNGLWLLSGVEPNLEPHC